ncbi:MAG TPA: TraR/DksA C4-type zinc finger protein [Candidatus Omnitrophota bacterium]|nr:TraR/DksA C4-type zinc finger protein [Candidatus Omnitrophota bacterium]HRZ15262.1 TraR/DksA C4-type zinc finger protein [Candidatus Omnitrophota bacterium]
MKKKLNKKELADYKKLIAKKKSELVDEISNLKAETQKSQKDAAGDISGYTYHMADVATDTYDREFSLGLVSNERKVLYELDDALKRIEDGTFGICEDCGEQISKSRLKALPYARLCVACQEKKDKR